MVVKIRLTRMGRAHRPFYRIVVADDKTPRDGKNLQIIGFYDPITTAKDDPKRVCLNYDAARHWLSVGAQPTDTVRGFLLRAGLMSLPSMVVSKKPPPFDTSAVDP